MTPMYHTPASDCWNLYNLVTNTILPAYDFRQSILPPVLSCLFVQMSDMTAATMCLAKEGSTLPDSALSKIQYTCCYCD